MILATTLQIFATLVLPIFLLIGVGFVADRVLRLDLSTLSRLCFHLFLPALIFVKILHSELNLAQMGRLILATGLLTTALLGLAFFLGWRNHSRPRRLVLSLGTAFFNAGNFGIPLAELAFPHAGASAMAVITMAQNLLTFSLGIYLIERRQHSASHILRNCLRLPVIHAILAALLLRFLDLQLIVQLRQPLEHLANGLIPVALLTLGVQLSRSPLIRTSSALLALSGTRLLVSPLLAWGMAPWLGLTPSLVAIFTVAAGLPVAVNVAIIAAEYKLEQTLAAQAILWTTLLSAFTLSVLLATLRWHSAPT